LKMNKNETGHPEAAQQLRELVIENS
jgi:hypothetical protein